MDKSLERQIIDELERAILRREWKGEPFTVGDVINDVKHLMEAPEIQKAIAIDRITEILEQERDRTGVMPTERDAKRLLEREREHLKITQPDREAALAERIDPKVDEDDIQ